ncbi:uncharacterized protein EKO05_0011232 [Ascochyta rabiei]|uniref:Uncharacterized protein n=1 Tax=Didymella rabiei TaxID=5454 RepID=A0A163E5V8_DIDRA|nr:uncharacterized protein EKO05_0011232 [Ascochyta rabiei]KZM23536.1 hypothetical protein ST47_g5329 [Ascochyta rabiei]UPX21026.1 hypothetical protein EKO05_0011232 [Ascochyta rabiei]
MFLALPVELRLRIAEYALEQRPAAGIPHIGLPLRQYKHQYRPSENLSLLLVCRQFALDFTPLAYNKTRFTLWTEHDVARMRNLPPHKLRNIRKLGFEPWSVRCEEWTGTGSSESFFCNQEQLRLDELVFFWPHNWVHMIDVRLVVRFLRRVRHIRTIKFVQYGGIKETRRNEYRSLIGMIMKEDHFQRYDAPGAPNIEATWWDWHLNSQQNIHTFQAQEPRPVLPEEDYMLLMKPRVDALMAEAEQAIAL